MRYFLWLVLSCVTLCITSEQVAAQFLVEQKVSFSKVLKFEQSKGSVKKADLKQGPLFKPGPPEMPEITVYKRALVFQRVTGADTLDAVYISESDKKLEDAALVQTGEFTWRLRSGERVRTIRDSLLISLDGKPRTFTATQKKLKKGVVAFTYAWADPSGYPRVFIDYKERKRIPFALKMRIEYNPVR